jgi:hypothetical protein
MSRGVRTRRARQAERDAARIELGADVEAQRQRDAAFAKATRRPNTKRKFSHRPGPAASSGRVNRSEAQEEELSRWVREFADTWDREAGKRRERSTSYEEKRRAHIRRSAREARRRAPEEAVDQAQRVFAQVAGWQALGRVAGVKAAYLAGAALAAHCNPCPDLILLYGPGEPLERRERPAAMYLAAMRQGWQEAAGKREGRL